MHLAITLTHVLNPSNVQKTTLEAIDSLEVSRIAAAQGYKGVRGLVSEIIDKRLPTGLYNFEVTDWEFVDDRA